MNYIMDLFKGKYSKKILQATLTGLGLNVIAGIMSMFLTGALWLFLAIPRSIVCWPIAATVSLPLMKRDRSYAVCTYIVAVLLFVLIGMYLDNLNDASIRGWMIMFYALFAIYSFPSIFILPSLFNGELIKKLRLDSPPPLPKEKDKNQQ